MDSRFVPGASVAAFDEHVISQLKLRTVSKWKPHPRMQIGIRNEAGEIYRVVSVDGLGRWVDTLDWFFAQGFTDEIGPDGAPYRNLDAIFSKAA